MPSANSANESAPSRSPSPPEEDSATELKRLSATTVSVINDRDFDYTTPAARALARHISPEYSARFENYPFTMTFSDHNNLWRKKTAEHPALHLTVLDVFADVHERDRVGNVYMTLAMQGVDDTVVHSLCELKWKCTRGFWICYAFSGFRKPCSDSGIACPRPRHGSGDLG